MQAINRDKVREMMENRGDVTVVEVLGEEYYEKFHLPGAANVPLNDSFESSIQNVASDKSAPVVVYCLDRACDASPKAARKLDELGYEEVYDYDAGKMDWKDAGLPIE
ncbi:molybdopterin biosynthesis protein MoeB [Maioricimonas rarisocia]|uniref:Molybdopterin biosynthesis protein MoeB n=1 Tax=Maioricimonas rarisocia TaxID=2528026 RepID=A0A517ZEJ2_9PLAN|nr:rhodanese-like domain-containing protein [Maioricimonas rarisocia]QDU40876.1 molybdopterin biosynthesis protein MoeB [Maioricimonas rarisocia]